jgi:hypothetical protein
LTLSTPFLARLRSPSRTFLLSAHLPKCISAFVFGKNTARSSRISNENSTCCRRLSVSSWVGSCGTARTYGSAFRTFVRTSLPCFWLARARGRICSRTLKRCVVPVLGLSTAGRPLTFETPITSLQCSHFGKLMIRNNNENLTIILSRLGAPPGHSIQVKVFAADAKTSAHGESFREESQHWHSPRMTAGCISTDVTQRHARSSCVAASSNNCPDHQMIRVSLRTQTTRARRLTRLNRPPRPRPAHLLALRGGSALRQTLLSMDGQQNGAKKVADCCLQARGKPARQQRWRAAFRIFVHRQCNGFEMGPALRIDIKGQRGIRVPPLKRRCQARCPGRQ